MWSPLTTHWAVNLVDSDPRNARVSGIQDHHAAGTDKWSVLALFAPGGRTVTPNYFVAGKEIWGIVPENRRAYTSGSPYDDHRAITMEILNLTGPPDWRFAADTIASVIRLNADIARRYGIKPVHSLNGIYEHRNIYSWTGRSYATACAGPSFNINQIISGVAAVLAGGNGAQKDAPEEEEEMLPKLIARRETGGKRTEWSLIHPEFGTDLADGESRQETVVVSDKPHEVARVTVWPGVKITTSSKLADAWGRLYARQFGNAPSDQPRAAYFPIQQAGKADALELRKARPKP